MSKTQRRQVHFNLVKISFKIYPYQQLPQFHMLLFSGNFYLVFYQETALINMRDVKHDAMLFQATVFQNFLLTFFKRKLKQIG